MLVLKIIHIIIGIVIGVAIIVAAEEWREDKKMWTPNLFALIIFAILEIIIIKSY